MYCPDGSRAICGWLSILISDPVVGSGVPNSPRKQSTGATSKAVKLTPPFMLVTSTKNFANPEKIEYPEIGCPAVLADPTTTDICGFPLTSTVRSKSNAAVALPDETGFPELSTHNVRKESYNQGTLAQATSVALPQLAPPSVDLKKIAFKVES